MLESKPKIIVLGVGNLLLQDEGVGIQVVDMLHEEDLDYPNLKIIDGGTSPEIMSLVEGADKLVIIDAVKGGKEPGTIYHFSFGNVGPSSPGDTGGYANLSLHQMHLIDNLQMLSLIGRQPRNVVVIGIEPKTIEPGLELSPEVRSKVPEIIALVKEEMRNEAEP